VKHWTVICWQWTANFRCIAETTGYATCCDADQLGQSSAASPARLRPVKVRYRWRVICRQCIAICLFKTSSVLNLFWTPLFLYSVSMRGVCVMLSICIWDKNTCF
jgi:hypothetical protein